MPSKGLTAHVGIKPQEYFLKVDMQTQLFCLSPMKEVLNESIKGLKENASKGCNDQGKSLEEVKLEVSLEKG